MNFDVVIIGGSFAGQAAALQLARARRGVLLIDAKRRPTAFSGRMATRRPRSTQPRAGSSPHIPRCNSTRAMRSTPRPSATGFAFRWLTAGKRRAGV
ncbi:NAD(P)-binding protein [Burkholderia pseudomallei]|uniref:NAD(P)-binding protein n=1 Tax=Burkholderia pseudomallei TaxID=28450 RepID=UPI0033164484